MTAAATLAAWEALNTAQRTRAEALVRHEQPELTRWTQAQGPVWRASVVAAAARLTRAEEVTPPLTQAASPLDDQRTALTEEDVP